MRERKISAPLAVIGITLLVGFSAHPAKPPSIQNTEADKLDRQIRELYKAGRYSDAVPIARKALEIRERTLGPVAPDTATSLNNLAELYQRIGDYGEAEPLLQRALKIREKVLGPGAPGDPKDPQLSCAAS